VSDSAITSPALSPAGPRWRLVGLMMLMVAMAHFNRLSITVIGTESILPEGEISEKSMGLVYTAYLLLYTLSMSPGGWFIDRFGARLALFVVGAGSAVFVALTGMAGFLWTGMPLLIGLIVIRGTMGIVNAPTHPGSARLVGDWIPHGRRSLVNGMANFAALIGISSTYFLFGTLMDIFDWPIACLIVSGTTMLMALTWGLLATSQPSAHPHAPRHHVAPTSFAWHFLLRNRSLLFLTLSYAALGYFEYLFFYWSEYYFKHVRHLSTADSRLYSTILTLAMGVGMFGGGWLTDWTRSRFPHRRTIALVPVLGLTISAVALVPGLLSPEPMITMLCFAFAMAAAGTCEGAFWTLAVEIGGSRGGLAAAILNTGGNAGGLIAPVLTPYISDWLGWKAGFVFAAVICLIGAICWIGIDPDERHDTAAAPDDV
jgi:MFS family permease